MLVSDISEDNALKLYHIQGISSTITYSIFINRDMKVSALKAIHSYYSAVILLALTRS